VLLPLLMQVLLGYTATHAGVTNLPRGLASFMIMPLVGILVGKVDPRKLLATGLIGSATAMFLLSRLSLDMSSKSFWVPLLLQGAALGFVFVPLTTVTNDPIPREKMGSATSIFNLMRNIGASIGISVVEALQFRKQQAHTNFLGEHIQNASLQVTRMRQALQAAFIAGGSDPPTAARKATVAVWGMVQRQASMMAYNDVFLLLAIMFVVMLPFTLLMKRPEPGAKAAMGH
jgi:DHA2 family multidrug resistance protein